MDVWDAISRQVGCSGKWGLCPHERRRAVTHRGHGDAARWPTCWTVANAPTGHLTAANSTSKSQQFFDSFLDAAASGQITSYVMTIAEPRWKK